MKKAVFPIIVIMGLVLYLIDLSFLNILMAWWYNYFRSRPVVNNIILITFISTALIVLTPFTTIVKYIKEKISKLDGPALNKYSKYLVSAFFFVILIIYLVGNKFVVDLTGLAICIFVVAPWFAVIVKSAKLPGGFEIVFNDIKEAQKLVESVQNNIKARRNPYTFLNILELDPNIAMAALRVELEKRLRTIGKYYKHSDYEPLKILFRSLRHEEVLTEQELNGIEELITVGNKAVHGAMIDNRVVDWAKNYGSVVLGILDKKINDLKRTRKSPK